jgi:hypothetical protein
MKLTQRQFYYILGMLLLIFGIFVGTFLTVLFFYLQYHA